MKMQLVSKTKASNPSGQIDLRRWNQVVNTTLVICPPLLMQPWQIELGRLRSSVGNDNYLQSVMDATSERLAIAKHLDIRLGQYELQIDKIDN